MGWWQAPTSHPTQELRGPSPFPQHPTGKGHVEPLLPGDREQHPQHPGAEVHPNARPRPSAIAKPQTCRTGEVAIGIFTPPREAPPSPPTLRPDLPRPGETEQGSHPLPDETL